MYLQVLFTSIASISLWCLLRRQRTAHFLNIPGPEPKSWWTGNLMQFFDVREGWQFHEMLLERFGAIVRYYTFLKEKRLYVYDTKALHHILVKDQTIFEEPTSFLEFNKLAFGEGLLATLGDHHRKQRKVLNPVFSTLHMRNILPTFYEIAHQLESTLKAKLQSGPQEIDMLNWLSRSALEFIGRSGLGHSFDPLTEDTPAQKYTSSFKELVERANGLMLLRIYIIPWAVKIGSPAFRRLVCRLIPSSNIHRIQELVDYLWEVSVEIYNKKKAELESEDKVFANETGELGADILKVLMKENSKVSGDDQLDEKEILGQETTSNAMTRMIYLLSLHPEVQDKLRKEVTEARALGDPDYDSLEALPYLDAVCRETLRLFPPIPLLFRVARRDTILPLSKPIRGMDNTQMTEIAIPKNTNIMISILNCNRNPDIWGKDALEWKPERWLQPLPQSVQDAKIPGVYSPLMTFNAGGRSCIGFKFSQLEMKVVMSILIDSFKFTPADKEITWQMGAVATPVVVNDTGSLPQLPVILHLTKNTVA
ncbi:hypothetical protein D9758_007246 [Tetrapyrgos nigripes]|uniref:Cytochrome P450 n=1 Tax=Tetrapyrgos nigripes TaxID=182062 RepID=A0A8H5D132_9AGAR|nr:hypothetical protein D9758_007246 [Tetrapyrgos nigripes]